VRVVRFYVSLPAFFLPPSSSSFLRRTSAASSGSEGSLPDLHRKLGIKVFSAGPPPQAPDQSVPGRTSAASSGSEGSPPDLHRKLGIKVFPAGPPPRAPDSLPELHRELRIRVFPAGAPPRAPDQSVPRRSSTASSGSECSPPGLNHKELPKICHRMPERISEDMAYIRLLSC